MQCKEWDDANSKSHDEAVHKNPFKSRLYDLISATLEGLLTARQAAGALLFGQKVV